MDDFRSVAEAVFREASGRILACLIRISGSFDRAEEALQEAFASALAAWQENGVPENAAAWIMASAHRKLIDAVRRENTRRVKHDWLRYAAELASTVDPEIGEPAMDLADDRLRLIFTCCHPALNQEAQVALTLRTLGGLTTLEIAKAFLLPEPTLAQRIVRAKRKIQEAHIPYEVPPANRLRERLTSVQAVIYLIFNEGYAAATGDALVRTDLCVEAIRLARVLCDLMPAEPENLALLSLMLLHDSRREARVRNGELVTMEEQDRSLWDEAAIAEGLVLLERALSGGASGPYQLQAAIAALHAQAKAPGDTDWPQIAALYESLLRWNPSPVVRLNHAVAVALGVALEDGLHEIEEIGEAGELEHYYLFHAARGDILRRLQRNTEAAEAYRRALALATNRVERSFLERRLQALG
ncbi:MAG TPA: sigma-70 family RNA polymerase sigma factor [Bryobacteraceae bacterium]|nr:sigma-70 family RNA polymerase sigma factor [Bryobacteraceae bacterium]